VRKAILSSIVILTLVFTLTGCKSSDYKEAMHLYDTEQYSAAISRFKELGNYKNSAEMVLECTYQYAVGTVKYSRISDIAFLRDTFAKLGDYKDSADYYAKLSVLSDALDLYESKNSEDRALAAGKFASLGSFFGSDGYVEAINAANAEAESEAKILDLYNYWSKEADKGNDPKYLTENPMIYETLDTIMFASFGYVIDDGLNHVYDHITYTKALTSLSNKIADGAGDPYSKLKTYIEQGIDYYYFGMNYNKWQQQRLSAMDSEINNPGSLATMDKEPSSVSITGTGVYLCVTGAAIPNLWDIYIPPFFIANKPENARYVLFQDISYKYYGKYDNGTVGYSTTAHMVLKDNQTGEWLAEETHSYDPPTSAPKTKTDEHAAVWPEDFTEINAKLKELYNGWR